VSERSKRKGAHTIVQGIMMPVPLSIEITERLAIAPAVLREMRSKL
jgi:hypothetical protein